MTTLEELTELPPGTLIDLASVTEAINDAMLPVFVEIEDATLRIDYALDFRVEGETLVETYGEAEWIHLTWDGLVPKVEADRVADVIAFILKGA